MNNRNQASLVYFIAIILLASLTIGSRIWLIDWPNFKPVLAVAIFLGFLFNPRIALVSILGIMLVSDAIIGFYSLPIMIAVYSAMLLSVALGYQLNRCLATSRSPSTKMFWTSSALVLGSTLFFLVTNSAVCFLTDWYPNSASGLVSSLAAGIPFFKYSLAGDLLFGTGIFSSFFMLQQAGMTKQQMATPIQKQLFSSN